MTMLDIITKKRDGKKLSKIDEAEDFLSETFLITDKKPVISPMVLDVIR